MQTMYAERLGDRHFTPCRFSTSRSLWDGFCSRFSVFHLLICWVTCRIQRHSYEIGRSSLVFSYTLFSCHIPNSWQCVERGSPFSTDASPCGGQWVWGTAWPHCDTGHNQTCALKALTFRAIYFTLSFKWAFCLLWSLEARGKLVVLSEWLVHLSAPPLHFPDDHENGKLLLIQLLAASQLAPSAPQWRWGEDGHSARVGGACSLTAACQLFLSTP